MASLVPDKVNGGTQGLSPERAATAPHSFQGP